MTKNLLALLFATSLLFLEGAVSQGISRSFGGGEINFSCANRTAFQVYVEVEGKPVTAPAVSCPLGQVCDAGADVPCVASTRAATARAFECTARGKFSDPNPCSSAFYLCIDIPYNGFRKIDLTCGPGFAYYEPFSRCVPQPAECSGTGGGVSTTAVQSAVPDAVVPAAAPVAPVAAFSCPSTGKYPVTGVCNQYYVCYRFLWSIRYYQATCFGNLEYNSMKRKCVPRWYSDCGLDRYQMPWRSMYYGKPIENSSEEDDFPDEDKIKKAIKKMEKELRH